MAHLKATPILSTSSLKVKVLAFPNSMASDHTRSRRRNHSRGTVVNLHQSHTSSTPTSILEVCFNCHQLGDPGEHAACCDGHDPIPLCHDCELKCPLCDLAARTAEMFRLWHCTEQFVQTGA